MYQVDRVKTLVGLTNMTAYLQANSGLPMADSIYTYSDHVSGHLGKNDYEAPEGEDANAWLKAWISDIARKAIGTGVKIEKDYSGARYSLTLRGEGFELRYSVDRASVCRKVVKGVRTEPARVVPEHIEPARTVEDVEWVCDEGSLLK